VMTEALHLSDVTTEAMDEAETENMEDETETEVMEDETEADAIETEVMDETGTEAETETIADNMSL